MESVCNLTYTFLVIIKVISEKTLMNTRNVEKPSKTSCVLLDMKNKQTQEIKKTFLILQYSTLKSTAVQYNHWHPGAGIE